MLKLQNGMLFQIKKFKKNKGLSLVEALVAIIVVGIGIVSVLQLSMYAVITADNAIVKNKANFLAEMMAEDILADRTNVKSYSQVFTCNLGQSSSQDQAGLVKVVRLMLLVSTNILVWLFFYISSVLYSRNCLTHLSISNY